MTPRIATCGRCGGEGVHHHWLTWSPGSILARPKTCETCHGQPELYAARRIAEQQEGADEG